MRWPTSLALADLAAAAGKKDEDTNE